MIYYISFFYLRIYDSNLCQNNQNFEKYVYVIIIMKNDMGRTKANLIIFPRSTK